VTLAEQLLGDRLLGAPDLGESGLDYLSVTPSGKAGVVLLGSERPSEALAEELRVTVQKNGFVVRECAVEVEDGGSARELHPVSDQSSRRFVAVRHRTWRTGFGSQVSSSRGDREDLTPMASGRGRHGG
jgi:hypothetical protein